MPFETLTTAPAAADFTPLQEHQEQTPGTFFDAKPVLHLHAADVQLLVPHADLAAQSVFPDLRATTPTNGAAAVNGSAPDDDDDDPPLAIPNLSVWVTSKALLIHSPTASRGVSIPYPTITLHAIQRLPAPAASGLYMQLLLNASDHTPDDDLRTLELTLVPAAPAPSVADLFAAVSACADLNPDPQDAESEDNNDDGLQVLGGGGGLPGAGGWITAENVGEHVDAEGNFLGFGGGALGAGAGTVHGREEGEGAGEEAGDDASGEAAAGGGDEAKWRRTE